MREAILSVDDDVDDHLLDYMIYYVYSRNEHAERFEYNVLLSLLDEESTAPKKKIDRIQSAKPKTTNSGEKNKISANFKDVISSNSDDHYSAVDDHPSDVIRTNRDPEPLEDLYDDSPRQKMP